MFDRIKKAFAKEPKAVAFPEPQPESAYADVSDWAGRSGFEFSIQGSGFALDGPVAGKACRIETGRASRKYIEGLELRGRAELDIHPDVLLVLMNRPLKESLEKQAYAL